MRHLEKGPGLATAPRDFLRDLNADNLSAGVVAGIFGLSAGIIHISAGTAAGLPKDFTLLWVISYLFINGLFGLLLPAYYRLPLPVANSIPGALLFAAIIPVVGLNEALGATLMAGAISVVVALAGWMSLVMRLIPMPIVMGMVAGVLLKFGTNMVMPLQNALIPAVVMIMAFFLSARFLRRIPPLVVTLVVGVLYMALSGADFSSVEFSFRMPEFIMPAFSMDAFLAYGLPLALILVGMETPAGVGLVKGMGYKEAPANAITFVGGIGTMVSAFFNLHSTCIAAPMTGICSSPEAGTHDKRWVAAVIVGIIFVVAAPFYGFVFSLIEAMPSYFIAIIAGLALLRVISSAMHITFSGKHEVGAMFSFLIAVSGLQIFGIGASFWALILGAAISMLVEFRDFDFSQERAALRKRFPAKSAG